MCKTLVTVSICIQVACLVLTAISFISCSTDVHSLIFYPSTLKIPDAPQYVPSLTEIEVLNIGSFDRPLYIKGTSCSWLSAAFQTPFITSKDVATLTVSASPLLDVGHHNCSISIFDGNSSYQYYVERKVTSNQYDVRTYEFSGSRSDILLDPSKYSFQISLRNPHSGPLSINEVFAESDFVSVFLMNDETELDRTDSMSPIRCVISDGHHSPGSYFDYISVQTAYDRVVVPVVLHQTVETFNFVEKELDFGVFRARNEEKSLSIVLEYSGMDNLVINSVYIRRPSPSSYLYVKEPAQSVGNNRTLLGSVTFRALMSGVFTSSIVVETSSSSGTFTKELPFRAKVIFENRVVNLKSAVLRLQAIHTTDKLQKTTLFLRKGLYSIPLDEPSFIIEEAQLVSCQHFMSISYTIVDLKSVILVEIHRDISYDEVSVNARTCWIEIASNISFHKVPLHITTGRVELDVIHGELRNHYTSISESSLSFRDLYDVDVGYISQMEPRDMKMVLTNYNPVDETITAIDAVMDTCVCLLAYIPIGANSLDRCIEEMKGLAAEDYHQLKVVRSSRCVCAGETPPTYGMELRSGFHTIVAIVPRTMRPNSIYSPFYRNVTVTDPTSRNSLVRIYTEQQEISLSLTYRPLSSIMHIECVDSLFCDIFPIGMRHVNIRVTVPTREQFESRILFDALTSTLSLNTEFSWSNSQYSAFDCKLSTALPRLESSRLFTQSLWIAILSLAKSTLIDISQASERLNSIENNCIEPDGGIHYAKLYEELANFQQLVSDWFSHGLEFNPTGMLISSQEASRSYVVSHPLAVLPQQVLPLSYELDLLVGCNRMSFVYVEYFNPFEVPVAVAMVSNHSVGPVKLGMEHASLYPLEKVDPERKLSIRRVIGPNGIADAILLHAVMIETLDSSKIPQSFFRTAGVSVDSQKQVGNLIRFPERQWLVPPLQSMLLGPIEITSSGSENEVKFTTLVYNNFSGFDVLQINLNNSRTKLVVRSVNSCHSRGLEPHLLECDWLPMEREPVRVDHKTYKVFFNRSQSTFAYKFVLHNEGTSMLVNQMIVGDVQCVGKLEQRPLSIDYFFKRGASLSVCRRLPFEILHNKSIELDIVVQELNIFQSFPLHVSLRESAPNGGVSTSFDVTFVFQDIGEVVIEAKTRNLFQILKIVFSFACLLLTLFLLNINMSMTTETANPLLQSSVDNMNDICHSVDISGKTLTAMPSRKLEVPTLQSIHHSSLVESQFSKKWHREKELTIAALKAVIPPNQGSKETKPDICVIPVHRDEEKRTLEEQPVSKRKGKGFSPVKQEPRKELQVEETAISDMVVAEPDTSEGIITHIAPSTELLNEIKNCSKVETIESTNIEPVNTKPIHLPAYFDEDPQVVKHGPPGLVQRKSQPHTHMRDPTESEDIAIVTVPETKSDFDDSPLFQYQGQLLVDDDLNFQFESNSFTSSHMENKFLQSLTSLGQQNGSSAAMSPQRHFDLNLDFETDFDLTGQMSLLDTVSRGIFSDEFADNLFSPSMPMDSLLSFLNEPMSSVSEQKEVPRLSRNDDFTWLGMNQLGMSGANPAHPTFFGPNQFFDLSQAEELEELEK